jgi:UDP-2,3-diacylglucosamine pyrophosphatase LpxH
LIGGWYFFWKMAVQPSLWITLSWAAITGFFAFCSIPGIVARYQREIDNVTIPKNTTAQQVIEDGYYQKHRDTINADVVVFGHTHFASSYGPNPETGNKLFINSGCWVGKDNVFNEKQRYTNTFVFIDEGGAYILEWRGSNKIDFIEAFPAGQQYN